MVIVYRNTPPLPLSFPFSLFLFLNASELFFNFSYRYSYDIECWQANGQLMTVGMIDTNGQFTLVAPIVWSNNSTKVPADYLYCKSPSLSSCSTSHLPSSFLFLLHISSLSLTYLYILSVSPSTVGRADNLRHPRGTFVDLHRNPPHVCVLLPADQTNQRDH